MEREGHLGMKIRYPMGCFNGKKMSILRVTVFLWKSVIMQEEVRLETDCILYRYLNVMMTVCVDVVVRLTVASVLYIHSCMKCASTHS